MTSRKLVLSCNMLMTAAVETDGDVSIISIEDARHASVGYMAGEASSESFKVAISKQALLLGLNALIDRISKSEQEQATTLVQKGADA